jgi:hypothetical protein
MILLISASQVARIIGMSHWCLANPLVLDPAYYLTFTKYLYHTRVLDHGLLSPFCR